MSKKFSDVGTAHYYKITEGKFQHDCLKKSRPHVFAAIFHPDSIFCSICHAQWKRQDRLPRIPHKFRCPDCWKEFVLPVDASDMMEFEPKLIGETLHLAAPLCDDCGSGFK